MTLLKVILKMDNLCVTKFCPTPLKQKVLVIISADKSGCDRYQADACVQIINDQ